VITISASPTSIHEGGTATYTIAASTPNLNAPIMDGHPMGGEAVYGQHYNLSGTNEQVTIPAGTTSTSVTLRAAVTNLTTKSEKATMVLQSSSSYKLPKSKSLKKASLTIFSIYP